MTTRSDYTDAEWEFLTDLPRMAAFVAVAADQGGPVTSTRELWASMMELAQATDQIAHQHPHPGCHSSHHPARR